MQNPYLAHALELVKSQAAGRSMTAEEITASIQSMTATLESLDNPQPAAPVEEAGGVKLVEGFKPKGSIRENCVISGLDGKEYKLLTKKHFEKFGTTAEAYREACGFKPGASLSCKTLAAARSERMKGMELWKRRKGATPAPAAEAY